MFTVDDDFSNHSDLRYIRYVDDIRLFTKSKRECEAQALRLENSVKRVGLIPNSSKTHILNTRTTPGWLRQLDYGRIRNDQRRRGLNRRSIFTRLQHFEAKQDFLKYARKHPGTPKDELSGRMALTRMLPDKDVIQKIVRIYPSRPDLWDLIFLYLADCDNDEHVQKFCWRRLRLYQLPYQDSPLGSESGDGIKDPLPASNPLDHFGVSRQLL